MDDEELASDVVLPEDSDDDLLADKAEAGSEQRSNANGS